MTLPEQLFASFIDKLLLAGILAYVVYRMNRLLEEVRRRNAAANDMARLVNTKRLDYLERQLAEFYWPLYIRLHCDNAVWDKILDRRKAQDRLGRDVGSEVESRFILPNHEEAVRIIQSKIHLAEDDGSAFQLMLRYVRHVAVFQAMRASGDARDPLEVGEAYPQGLDHLISTTAFRLQAEYDDLIANPMKSATETTSAEPNPS